MPKVKSSTKATSVKRPKTLKKPTEKLKPNAGKILPLPAVDDSNNQSEKERPLTVARGRLQRIVKRHPKPEVMPDRVPKLSLVLRKTFGAIAHNKYVFLGILVIYGLLTATFVNGFTNQVELPALKEVIQTSVPGGSGEIASNLALFSVLITNRSIEADGAILLIQFILGLIASLAIVWTLRRGMTGESVRLRDSFYKGMYPLVPVVLVLCIILVQLVPFAIVSNLFLTVMTTGIAASLWEGIVWSVLLGLTIMLTLYWLSSSILAVYVATLPDMAPFAAIRSAADLVRFRRWAVIRKLLFLPFMIFVFAALVMLPVLWFAVGAAQWVFFVVAMVSTLVVHSYIYTLYRELLA